MKIQVPKKSLKQILQQQNHLQQKKSTTPTKNKWANEHKIGRKTLLFNFKIPNIMLVYPQLLVNWWFGLVIWIFGILLWKGLLPRGRPRIPNHQVTTSWIPPSPRIKTRHSSGFMWPNQNNGTKFGFHLKNSKKILKRFLDETHEKMPHHGKIWGRTLIFKTRAGRKIVFREEGTLGGNSVAGAKFGYRKSLLHAMPAQW